MPTSNERRYSVIARNLSAASENRIHDDAVARSFGFSGGLVPGVEVYAYMLNPVVQHYGEAWLARGTASVKLLKPAYDGEEVVVTAQPGDDGAVVLQVVSGDRTCAAGSASIGNERDLPDIPEAPLPAPEAREDATPETLHDGRVLGTFHQRMDAHELDQYLAGIQESDPVYRSGGIVHPGWLLRMANRVLSGTVRLGPWMHVGSTVRNVAVARYGDLLAARGRVRRSYDHKGHLFVDIDVLIVNRHDQPIQYIDHVSIYRPRQVREAA